MEIIVDRESFYGGEVIGGFIVFTDYNITSGAAEVKNLGVKLVQRVIRSGSRFCHETTLSYENISSHSVQLQSPLSVAKKGVAKTKRLSGRLGRRGDPQPQQSSSSSLATSATSTSSPGGRTAFTLSVRQDVRGTYADNRVSVEHVIVATAKCSTGRLAGWRTVEAERRVRVTPAIDADAAPLLEPAHVARTKRLKRLLVPCGYVEASLCTHRTGFCPGDMVDVNVDVRNTSRDPLCEVILGLRETVRLTSGKEYSRTLLQTGNLIPADRQAVQENTIFATSASVPIPYEATYSEHAGDVLVSHALVATLKGPSGKKVASLVCPIFVATFHSQAAQAGLPEGLAVPSAPPYPAEKEVEVVEVGEEPILYNHSPLARNNFCVICMNHEQTHCAVPCGHKCMCQACAELAAKTGFCPMCRQNIDSIIRVYE